MIVDNDFAGDPDGLVSLAHVLLTDDVRVELITCSPVDPVLAHLAGIDASATASLGARTAHALLGVLDRAHHDIVAVAEDFTAGGEPSDAARAMVEVCVRESDTPESGVPLAILCGGPLTNVAAALALEPTIRERATLVWIGGSSSGGPEYNRDTDAPAAASVLASGIPVAQVPLETYERLRVSVAEVRADLAHASYPGSWLADRLLDLPAFVTLHGVITLGDSALASVVALDPGFRPDAGGRVVADFDMRLLWGDLLAKLRLHHREADSG
ncbi:nucleoside hydrolase [Microbacterium sp. RU33B]|uniref:nucleoside hydrolase n=1 Tax=Microbacterium sp. RU33B TaxID=1907390 RepID=UPI000964FB14|nr:nucleoside hydrolase [Microbacterium sp. RU33B]SIT83552.1 Inosine-uridine preferring nucleoside hydrolase [Microbacterium sp. RU33B]